MSFRCENCGKAFANDPNNADAPKAAPARVVTKIRQRNEKRANGERHPCPGSWEIEKEMSICKSCVAVVVVQNPPRLLHVVEKPVKEEIEYY